MAFSGLVYEDNAVCASSSWPLQLTLTSSVEAQVGAKIISGLARPTG